MRPTLPILLWRAVAGAGAPLIRAHLKSRARQGKEEAGRLAERFGETTLPRPEGTLFWIHAASVGESQSVLSLIDRLLGASPTAHVLLTTGTVTSATLMAGRLPSRAIHQYAPFDRPAWVRTFLMHWKPDVAIWVESELWPNMIAETKRAGVPLALINARMSKRSHRGWQRWRATARALLSAFDAVLAQDQSTAARLHDLGGRHARALGNLKRAAAPLHVDDDARMALVPGITGRPLWCAASIHRREEAMILDAHESLAARDPRWLTIIAPRQPNRGRPLAEMARARGLTVAQRSSEEPLTTDTKIYIADTIGEMGLFYSLSPIAFLGRSLVPFGGSNPLEAAPLNCAAISGPHTDNFTSIYAALDRAAGVLCVASAEALAEGVATLARDETRRRALVDGALTLITEAQEVLEETAQTLEALAQRSPDAAA